VSMDPERPKDALDRHEADSHAIYDRNAAQPLPTRPGEFYASHAVQHAQHYSAEHYEKTGERLPVEIYRTLDFLPLSIVEQIIDGDVANRHAERRVAEDPDGEAIALAKRIEADTEEARSRIIARYGPKDGPELLERTQRWVKTTQPTLARMLQQRGLGSKPEIVEELVAYVFSNGIR
jgi:hypothetical protein